MYSDKGEVPEGEYLLPIGQANVVTEGTDVTLVSFGKMMKVVNEAATDLEKKALALK